MNYPKENIAAMVNFLKKEKKMSVSKIEKELGFGNGLIGKVIKGRTTLSEEKLNKLGKLYFDKSTEGKQVGYLKILPDGTTEVGVHEPNAPVASNKAQGGTNVKNMNKPTGTKEVPVNEPKTNETINTLPKPIRMDGENAIDYAFRVNEWKQSLLRTT